MGEIYAKDKVETKFESIYSEIENYLKERQVEIDGFAVKVERDASAAEAPIT